MNVYDFDNTIYDGESVFDFYLYSVRKQPGLVTYMFAVVKALIKYKLCRMSEEEFQESVKKYAKRYLDQVRNLDELICTFWDKNQHKVKDFYKAQQREDDVIISASVDFLLAELFSRIGIQHFIASKVDRATGDLVQMCYQKNKVALFKQNFPNAQIENFYTDSKNDVSMMQLAERVYMVKGNHIRLMDRKEYEEA